MLQSQSKSHHRQFTIQVLHIAMIKDTGFVSKKVAEAYKEPVAAEHRILISCTTPGKKIAKLHNDSWRAVLRLQFHDADPGHMNKDEACEYKYFTQEQAVEVLKILKEHQDGAREAIVHCEAGISRSAAIAKFISVIYSLDFPDRYSVYNKHVFSTLMRVYGESSYSYGLLPPESLPGIQGDQHDRSN